MNAHRLIRPDFIHLNADANTFEAVIDLIGHSFLTAGVVKESYIPAVIAREKLYPTGLPASGHNIAIPHTESEHVFTSSIGVVVTKKAIKVRMMGSPQIELDCHLFFPLAMEDPHTQLGLLRVLMVFLQDEQKLTAIRQARSVREVEKAMSALTLLT